MQTVNETAFRMNLKHSLDKVVNDVSDIDDLLLPSLDDFTH